ncbi:MAG TPA: hypothetical protein VKV20_08040 [Ktedonobacteraceae bacterium]|nr:hypothetical protein [Ktedonobacteraceae bacterium]
MTRILAILALVVGVALFVFTLATNTNANNLLLGAALLWPFNILVFALWCRELAGEGPWKRHLSGPQPVISCFHNRRTIPHTRQLEYHCRWDYFAGMSIWTLPPVAIGVGGC